MMSQYIDNLTDTQLLRNIKTWEDVTGLSGTEADHILLKKMKAEAKRRGIG